MPSHSQEHTLTVLTNPSLEGFHQYLYDRDNEWWCSVQDGHNVVELLVRELTDTCQGYVNL